MIFQRTLTSGLVALMLTLGSGSRAEEEKKAKNDDKRSSIAEICESMSTSDRLRYIFSRVSEYQPPDQGPAGTLDGSYIDDETECRGYSHQLEGQLELRAIHSQPGEKCKVDGMVMLSLVVDNMRYTLIIPDHKKETSNGALTIIPNITQPEGVGLVVVSRSCETMMSKAACTDIAQRVLYDASKLFCAEYKRQDFKRSI
ncbi:hypothetical protein HYT52_01190 [Candidatus Woesearchaeota archaeon]|nr:hypothetical protein [Candidatus Woesearchaeota archaeon]